MLYTPNDVQYGTTVHDLDRRSRLERVLSINTETAEIVVHRSPLVVSDSGEIATETLRYSAVWPILDRGVPCAFHCHGRLN